jgi:hypothetical protein
LIDPGDTTVLAEAVSRALSNATLRAKGAEYNLRLVSEKVTYAEVMAKVEAFYRRIRGRKST